ncbi:MAG TPA: carboxypeptidase-like regulatory domain-containing protein, partial [Steroidobacteraceae bacterium]|nr:carboxypeptidase-like regulatory domain-containing protein [Steroidobacteraceae bacterium]
MIGQGDSASHKAKKSAAGPSRVRVLLGCLIVVALVVDLLVLDRWGFSGHIRDEQGRPVSGAAILSDFTGLGPVVVLPVPPDPPSRHEHCMDSRLATSDKSGAFSFAVFTRNRLLVAKSASLLVYKPGFKVGSFSFSISSSLFSRSPNGNVRLSRSEKERKESTWSERVMDQLPPVENTYADDVVASTFVVTQ